VNGRCHRDGYGSASVFARPLLEVGMGWCTADKDTALRAADGGHCFARSRQAGTALRAADGQAMLNVRLMGRHSFARRRWRARYCAQLMGGHCLARSW